MAVDCLSRPIAPASTRGTGGKLDSGNITGPATRRVHQWVQPARPVRTVRQAVPSHGVWRSLVAHCVWDARAAGSNPVTPTTRCTPGVKIGQGRPIPLLAPQQSMRPAPPMTLARGPIPLMVSRLPNRMHLAEQPGDVNPERGQDPDARIRVLSARHNTNRLTNCMQSATLVTPGPVAQSAEHGDV